jgi:hypothetical protein
MKDSHKKQQKNGGGDSVTLLQNSFPIQIKIQLNKYPVLGANNFFF